MERLRADRGEHGLKHASRRYGVSVNGFFTNLKHQVGQGLVTILGKTAWVSLPTPDVSSFGVEVEASWSPSPGLLFLGSATVLKAQFATCPDSTALNPARTCPKFTKVGTFTNGVNFGHVRAGFRAVESGQVANWALRDRKSTRLNSSH